VILTYTVPPAPSCGNILPKATVARLL
jgi:hypothetical protein